MRKDPNGQRAAIKRVTETKLALLQKQAVALQMRLAGKTYDEIADALNYQGRAGAWKAVESALLETIKEPSNALRALEIERLDKLHGALWPVAMKGDLAAVASILKIAERRARLLGLDAPETVEAIGGAAVRFVVRANGTPWDGLSS